MRKLDLTNQVFGRLTVISFVGSTKTGQARWLCQCSCGQQKIAIAASLRYQNVRSCGCLSRDTTSARNKIIHLKHGATVNHKPTTEWLAWSSMKDRCRNPNNARYRDYGGRGITFSPDWETFPIFLQDMGNKPDKSYSLDRIDNSLGYSKENCRWASPKAQCNNRRNNHQVTIDGRTQSVAVWARELGITRREVLKRDQI